MTTDPPADVQDEMPPAIGPYRIVRELGSGGFGAVYLGVREDDTIKRQVAIKLIRRDRVFGDLVQRFKNERQTLVGLGDHPNIATLLEAGEFEDGRPYFVMEYVEGSPVDQFCASSRLSIVDRLRLFQQICSAVHYAHQNLVVHRDLKPANVLVKVGPNRAPCPVLLDFGLAKILNPELGPHPLQPTEPWIRLLTPEYASPEQARGETITTASDIYSAGVLLYKLLTGSFPYRFLDRHDREEVRRVVCTVEPLPPSVLLRRASALDLIDSGLVPSGIRPEVAAKRLRRQLAGDIDNIVLMAMRKEPQRRYASAEQMAADIRCHMVGLPVIARRDTLGYRCGKFIRRNRVGVAAAAIIALSLLGGIIGTSSMAIVAAHQRTLAEQAREEAQAAQRAESKQRDQAQRETELAKAINALLEDMLSAPDPWTDAPVIEIPLDTKVVDVLGKASAGIEAAFPGRPLVEAALRAIIGRTYFNLGYYKEAARHLERSRDLYRHELAEEHPDTLTSMTDLGRVYRNQSRYDEAESLFDRTLKLRSHVLGDEHPDTLASMANLAMLYWSQTRYDEAEALYLNALGIQRRVLGEEHPDTLGSMSSLAVVYKSQGRYDEAEPLQLKVLAIRRRTRGEVHPRTLTSMSHLAGLYSSQGRYGEAEPLRVKALEIARRVLGEEHPYTLIAMNNLAAVYQHQHRYDKAEPLHAEALEIQRRVLGEEHPNTLTSMNNLAGLYEEQGRNDEAEELHLKTLEIRRRVLGEEHPHTLTSMNNLAFLYRKEDRHDEAESLQVDMLEISRRVLGEQHPTTLTAMNNLAGGYERQGEYDEAEPLYVEALELRRRVLGNEHPGTLTSMYNLAGLYKRQGKYDEAEPLYVEALEAMRRVLGKEHPHTLSCMHNLAGLYKRQGEYDEAEPLYVEALKVERRVLGEEDRRTLIAMTSLADLYENQGRYDEAEALYAESALLHKRVMPPGFFGTGITLAGHGVCLTKLERYNEAESPLLEARQILEAARGAGHKRTIEVIQSLIDLYDAWGKPAKAAEWRVKLADEVNLNEQDD